MWKNYVRFFTALMIVASVSTSALGQSKAFDVANMDRSADACDNFFQFADGNWVKNTPIPPSQSRWGSFNMLSESNRDVLHDILEKAEKEKAAAGSNVQMIGDFYASCMDEAAIEKAGSHPLDAEFARINKINTVDDLKREIAELHRQGLPALFRFGGGPDQRNSNMVILNAGQGGLSLPNKEYYTLDTPSMTATRTKFVEHMTNMFKLLGDSPEGAAANAKTVMDVQTRLANASMAPDQLRNRDKNYNKITLADAQANDILDLKTEVETLTARLDETSKTLDAAEDRGETLAATAEKAELALSAKEAEAVKLAGELDERSLLADKQTKELAALKVYLGALKERLDVAEKELQTADERRAAERLELDSAIQQMMDERTKFVSFHGRVSELVEQLLAQSRADKNLARRARELETRLAEQTQLLEASELERNHLREEIEAALKTEAERRTAMITEIDNSAKAEKAKLQAALDRANGDRTRLVYELANAKRQVEASKGAERPEGIVAA